MAKQGRAAVTVCSAAFVTLGRAQAKALGNAALPIAVVPHPFGARKRDEVRAMAEQCVRDIAQLLAGGGAK